MSPAKARTKACGHPTCQKDMLVSVHHILQIMPLTAPPKQMAIIEAVLPLCFVLPFRIGGCRALALIFLCSNKDKKAAVLLKL